MNLIMKAIVFAIALIFGFAGVFYGGFSLGRKQVCVAEFKICRVNRASSAITNSVVAREFMKSKLYDYSEYVPAEVVLDGFVDYGPLDTTVLGDAVVSKGGLSSNEMYARYKAKAGNQTR